MLTLTVSERLSLKGQAHSINPTVLIGNAGLTEAVFKEIDLSLNKHELIKVRVMAERDARESMLEEICQQLNAAPVQHIGKILVIYRPRPEEDAAAAPAKKARRRVGRLTKRQQGERQ